MTVSDDFYLIDLKFDGDFRASSSSDLQVISGKANALQALFNRLITNPGAISHRPNYGVGAKNFQNKVGNLGTQRDLALKIKSQFELDFRCNKVLGIGVMEQPGGLFIIRYRVELKGFGETSGTFNPFGEFEI